MSANVRTICLLTVLICAACRGSRPSLPPVIRPGGEAERVVATPEDLARWMREGSKGYPLYVGDDVEITVQGHPEYTTRKKIPPDGRVALYGVTRPGTGGDPEPVVVSAAGKRIPELEKELTSYYAPYVSPPYVTVRVASYAPKTIYIAGAVANPSDYRLPDDTRVSLVQALTMAGWFAADAADDRVRLIRLDPLTGKRIFLPPIDVRSMVAEGRVDMDLPLEPGDTITVDSKASRSVFIFGEIASPGEYPCTQGLTITRLIALAGGLNEFARVGDIRVLRYGDAPQPEVYSVDLDDIYDGDSPDFQMLPGDVVKIAERFI